MNSFFDYIFIRIFSWYDNFQNDPSEFTAKLLVSFLQLFLILDLVALAAYQVVIPILYLKIAAGLIWLALFVRANARYKIPFIVELKLKWRGEKPATKVVKGLLIPLLIVMSGVIFVILGRNNPGH